MATVLMDDRGHKVDESKVYWIDMIGDLLGKKLYKTTGKVDTDWDENAVKFQSGGSIDVLGDRIQWNIQINHNHVIGVAVGFYGHLHFFQVIDSNGNFIPFELTLKWRLQRNGHAKTDAWTTQVLTITKENSVFDFTALVAGVYNQLSSFEPFVVDCEISDTFQFQMARTDSEPGDLLVYFNDVHGRVDSRGSDAENSKLIRQVTV